MKIKEKTFLWWVIFILLVVWQFPQFLVSLMMMPFLGKLRLIASRHFNFAWSGEKMRGGISLGPFAFLSEWKAGKPEYIAHEVDGHTVDSKIFGPLYLLVIGIPSILNAIFDFTECYFSWYPEKWANRHAGLVVDEYCRLHFADPEPKNP